MIYFTSDTHYGHANIIKYCARPFADVSEMNRELVRMHNEVVGPRDTVYHLGDFAFGPPELSRRVLRSLNGTKILVKGNHDRGVSKMRELGFDDAVTSLALSAGGTDVLLVHDPDSAPTVEWPHLVLCGHVHTAWSRKGKFVNVGVDVRGYRPATLDQLCNRLQAPGG